MYQWQLIDPSSSMHHINDPSLSIGFHFEIYQSHQGQYIYIVHQSSINQLLDINDIWSNNLPNNQTIGINDNMIQQRNHIKGQIQKHDLIGFTQSLGYVHIDWILYYYSLNYPNLVHCSYNIYLIA